MKHLIFALSLVYSLSAFSEITIVSDLDDTIKITNAGSAGRATYNGIFTEKVFIGIPEFLSEARNYTERLHVVTASPPIIGKRVRATLFSNNIRYDSVIFKGVTGGETKINFKVNAIKRIIERTGDQVILIGDDVNHDPEAYEEVRKAYPEKVLAIYIHVINGRPIADSATKYWTSFDLALREFVAGRMDIAGVDRVARAVLDSPKLSYIIPRFAECPSQENAFQWQMQTIFVKEAAEVTQKLNKHCVIEGQKPR